MKALRQRCRDLLADRATHDLSVADQRELESILAGHPEWEEQEAQEITAAALHLAWLGSADRIPADVLQRVRQRAGRWTPPRR